MTTILWRELVAVVLVYIDSHGHPIIKGAFERIPSFFQHLDGAYSMSLHFVHPSSSPHFSPLSFQGYHPFPNSELAHEIPSPSLATNMLHSVQELVCKDCMRQFKRVQELKRHLKEKHEPWPRCPFCTFQWTRPDKIKHHITTYHQDKFTAEEMAEFRALNGKRMIAFLDRFDHGPAPRARADVETAPTPDPSRSPSPSRDSSPS